MNMELDVLNEAHAALVKADTLNPGLDGPVEGLGLYAPLAAAVRRLADWLRAEAAAAPQEKEGRGQRSILHGPQVSTTEVGTPQFVPWPRLRRRCRKCIFCFDYSPLCEDWWMFNECGLCSDFDARPGGV